MSDSIDLRRFLTKLKKDVVPALKPLDGNLDPIPLALTALVLTTSSGMPIAAAPQYVVDGGEDFGIDGLYFNTATRVLYLAQSKLRTNQNKSVCQAEILKFTRGVNKLLRGEVSDANEKIRSAFPMVEEALDDINAKIVLCIACTSTRSLEPNVEGILIDFCRDANKLDEIFSYRYINFNSLFQAAKFFSTDTSTDTDIEFQAYSHIPGPHQSYFGTVTGSSVADWVIRHGEALFDQNVRSTLHKSSVNEEILRTLKQEPDKFWYFNNGITAIAMDVRSAAADSTPKKISAKAMSIVNGAQTAGMLAKAKNDGVDLAGVRVQFRIISLAKAAPGLDEQITKANNTQNDLSALDFVSLDVAQEILRNQLAELGYSYIYKRGGGETEGTKIEVKDAAVALACKHGLSLTAQAKRYVSGLWNDIHSPPYTQLFNQATTGEEVLRAWKILKACEDTSKEMKQQESDKDKALILTHGDKFLAHCVFSTLAISTEEETDGLVREICRKTAERIIDVYSRKRKSYPAADFKNVGALEEFKDSIKFERILAAATTELSSEKVVAG